MVKLIESIDIKADAAEIEFQKSFMANRVTVASNGTAKGFGSDYHSDRIIEVKVVTQ